MTVRAKFKVQSITHRPHWQGNNILIGEVDLAPVTSGSEENAAFYAATPAGAIKLATINEEALKQFVIGGEYYVDFTPTQAA